MNDTYHESKYMEPSPRDNLIAACKREIRYRADYMMLDYDLDDITHWDIRDGNTVVLLTHIYLPQQDEEAERVKDPTVYIAYPPPMMNCWEKPSNWKLEVKTYLPTVRVRMPTLICIIDPEDNIITDSNTSYLLQAMADKDERAVYERMFTRWSEICFIQKAEDILSEIVEREREGDCYN